VTRSARRKLSRAGGPWAALALAAALLSACAAPLRPTATPVPTAGPAPKSGPAASGGPPPGMQQVVVNRGATPTAVPGSRAPEAQVVKMRRQFWLLEAPQPSAARLPVGLVGGERTWDVKEQVEGWVRIDAGPFTGWAPVDAVEFVR
jgi:hypothetical protein